MQKPYSDVEFIVEGNSYKLNRIMFRNYEFFTNLFKENDLKFSKFMAGPEFEDYHWCIEYLRLKNPIYELKIDAVSFEKFVNFVYEDIAFNHDEPVYVLNLFNAGILFDIAGYVCNQRNNVISYLQGSKKYLDSQGNKKDKDIWNAIELYLIGYGKFYEKKDSQGAILTKEFLEKNEENLGPHAKKLLSTL
jgi:hypothetical protein